MTSSQVRTTVENLQEWLAVKDEIAHVRKEKGLKDGETCKDVELLNKKLEELEKECNDLLKAKFSDKIGNTIWDTPSRKNALDK